MRTDSVGKKQRNPGFQERAFQHSKSCAESLGVAQDPCPVMDGADRFSKSQRLRDRANRHERSKSNLLLQGYLRPPSTISLFLRPKWKFAKGFSYGQFKRSSCLRVPLTCCFPHPLFGHNLLGALSHDSWNGSQDALSIAQIGATKLIHPRSRPTSLLSQWELIHVCRRELESSKQLFAEQSLPNHRTSI